MGDKIAVDPQLYGSWRVTGAQGTLIAADGTRTESASDLEGVLIFTPEHRMISFVVHPGRIPADDDAGRLALFHSMVAYSGRFTLAAGQYHLTIDWSSTTLNEGTPQVRHYEIVGDTLRVTVPEHANIFDPTKRNSNVLTAIREKS